MCFFKKKAAVKTHEDKALIEQNYKSADALIVLAAGNEALVSEFKDLREKLKYLIATENNDVVSYDKKISDLIGDMKIALTKDGGEFTKKAENTLTQIKLAIAERNAKM